MANGPYPRSDRHLLLLFALTVLITAGMLLFGPRQAEAQLPPDARAALPIPRQAQLTATPTDTCVPAWSLVSSLDPDPDYDILVAVSALSSGDVWAVGHTAQTNSHTLVEH